MVKDNLLETFKQNKLNIIQAINTLSPFLEVLQHYSLISELTYHMALKEYQKSRCMYNVVYNILTQLEHRFNTKILEALFHPFNLQKYPLLKQIQCHFKDVTPDASAPQGSRGPPVQNTNLEWASAVMAPQNSVQVALNGLTPQVSMGFPIQNSGLERTSAVRAANFNVKVIPDGSAPQGSRGPPVQSSCFERTSAIRAPQSSVQVTPDVLAPQGSRGPPVQSSCFERTSAIRAPQSSVQVTSDRSILQVSMVCPLQKCSLEMTSAVRAANFAVKDGSPQGSLGSPVQKDTLEWASDAMTPQNTVPVIPDGLPQDNLDSHIARITLEWESAVRATQVTPEGSTSQIGTGSSVQRTSLERESTVRAPPGSVKVTPHGSTVQGSIEPSVQSTFERTSAVRAPQSSVPVTPEGSTSQIGTGSSVQRTSLERESTVRVPPGSVKVTPEGSTSQIGAGSSVQRTSLERESTVRAPPGSVKVTPEGSTSQIGTASSVQRTSLERESTVRIPPGSVKVTPEGSTSQIGTASSVQRTSLERESTVRIPPGSVKVTPEGSTSQIGTASSVQSTNLEKESAVSTPQSSVPVIPDGSTQSSLGSLLPRSNLDRASAIRTPQSSVQVTPNRSAPQVNMESPVQRSNLEKASAVRTPQSSVQGSPEGSTSLVSVESPMQRSCFGGESAVRTPQSPIQDSSDDNEPPIVRRRRKWGGVRKVRQVRNTDTSNNNESSSVRRRRKWGGVRKVRQVRDTDANNNNEPSNVRRRRKWGGVRKVRQVRDTDTSDNNEPASVRRRRKWRGVRKVRQVRDTGSSDNNEPSSVGRRRKWGGIRKVRQVRDTVFINIQNPKVNFHLPELPVTCGMVKGTLHKEKIEKGSSEKCIEVDGKWLTPREFEVKGGRERAKNWKKSIFCGGLTLHNLILDKFLPCPPTTRHKRKKTLPAGKPSSQPEAEKRVLPSQSPPAQNEAPPQPKRRRLQRKMQVPKKTPFSPFYLSAGRSQVTTLDSRPKYRAQLQAREWIHVTCRVGKGHLYKNRFASAYRGKCIQTESGWYTPAEFLAKDPEFEIASWTQSIYSGRLPLQCLIENKILNLHESSCSCAICKEEDIFPENSDECSICADGGKLFCCDSCPRSFHGDCHIPAISQENCTQWFCTFCIIRKNKEKRSPDNKSCQLESEVLKQQMCFEQQMKCEYLLMKMYCCRESMLFATDPRNFTAYSKCVREPMWLDLIKKRLSEGTYNTVQGFVLDMRLIFNNCKKFNKDNQFGHLGAKMKEKFEKDFKEIFEIEE
ncbi:uncharacterized protein LOC141541773 isoform X11 [Sminthopsis crassicaudata]|uniref:uncharacterized protein LOC141541773 isoform X11 n=1 Tax=Sminthopsis crassicaudata TaxID=9301 RepID=UPI003D69ED91